MKNIFLCLTNVIFMVIGQIVFKYGTKGKIIDSVPSVISVIFTPIILTGFTIYAFSSILWIYILSKLPLSFAYPVQALAFPLVLIISMFLFKEAIPATRWVGVLVIFIGVFIVVR